MIVRSQGKDEVEVIKSTKKKCRVRTRNAHKQIERIRTCEYCSCRATTRCTFDIVTVMHKLTLKNSGRVGEILMHFGFHSFGSSKN